MKFLEQYGTAEWKNRRKEILKIDNHKCRRCSSTMDLQVHHLHYVNGQDVWDYPDSELVTLCRSCHQEIHSYKDELNKSLLSLMDCWCMDEDAIVSDYYDALQILRYLSTLGGTDSRRYADICTSAGMTFACGGSNERLD